MHNHAHHIVAILAQVCAARKKPAHPSPAFDRMLGVPGLSCQAPSKMQVA